MTPQPMSRLQGGLDAASAVFKKARIADAGLPMCDESRIFIARISAVSRALRRYSRLTFSPFMARFIVRTEHMAPHMVQVLGLAGLADAT